MIIPPENVKLLLFMVVAIVGLTVSFNQQNHTPACRCAVRSSSGNKLARTVLFIISLAGAISREVLARESRSAAFNKAVYYSLIKVVSFFG